MPDWYLKSIKLKQKIRQAAELKVQIDERLKEMVICHSKIHCSSPLVPIKKKTGRNR